MPAGPSDRRVVLIVHMIDPRIPNRDDANVYQQCKEAMHAKLMDSFRDCEERLHQEMSDESSKVHCGLMEGCKLIFEEHEKGERDGRSIVSMHIVLWKVEKKKPRDQWKLPLVCLDKIHSHNVHVSTVCKILSAGDLELFNRCQKGIELGYEDPTSWDGWPKNGPQAYLIGFDALPPTTRWMSRPSIQPAGQVVGQRGAFAAAIRAHSMPEASLTTNVERRRRKRTADDIPVVDSMKRARLDDATLQATSGSSAEPSLLASTRVSTNVDARGKGKKNRKGKYKATRASNAVSRDIERVASTSRAAVVTASGKEKATDREIARPDSTGRASLASRSMIAIDKGKAKGVDIAGSQAASLPIAPAIPSPTSISRSWRAGPAAGDSEGTKRDNGKQRESDRGHSSTLSISSSHPLSLRTPRSAIPQATVASMHAAGRPMPPPAVVPLNTTTALFPSVTHGTTDSASARLLAHHVSIPVPPADEPLTGGSQPDSSHTRPYADHLPGDDSDQTIDSLFDASFSSSDVTVSSNIVLSAAGASTKWGRNGEESTRAENARTDSSVSTARRHSQHIRGRRSSANASTSRVQEQDSTMANRVESITDINIRAVCDCLVQHYAKNPNDPVFQEMFDFYYRLESVPAVGVKASTPIFSDTTNRDLPLSGACADWNDANYIIDQHSKYGQYTSSEQEKFKCRRSSGVTSGNNDSIGDEQANPKDDENHVESEPACMNVRPEDECLPVSQEDDEDEEDMSERDNDETVDFLLNEMEEAPSDDAEEAQYQNGIVSSHLRDPVNAVLDDARVKSVVFSRDADLFGHDDDWLAAALNDGSDDSVQEGHGSNETAPSVADAAEGNPEKRGAGSTMTQEDDQNHGDGVAEPWDEDDLFSDDKLEDTASDFPGAVPINVSTDNALETHQTDGAAPAFGIQSSEFTDADADGETESDLSSDLFSDSDSD
ncbi:uncharacterized protein LAESUDRAFT_763311 [Laetiporus sulphureus 93-53]|uniref:Uncharacterized protein n=1 Tax=Laetiporus sulphureus 93-53 TaxID=1314785 RepID=A0A165BY90_9APHY|nr:uncharacterized protein LAESUDRAFT_763311 [Laetiporus sulphureus 93-53]KZT01867.1 hypothetical protein LAESUDRAFT_763311 [Laetiporus sulphureus 93-53]